MIISRPFFLPILCIARFPYHCSPSPAKFREREKANYKALLKLLLLPKEAKDEEWLPEKERKKGKKVENGCH